MKNIFILLSILAVLFVSCNTNNSADNSNAAPVSLTVDEFIMSADSFNDIDVSVSGLVTHVCKHGGQKLFLAGNEEGVSLRIETGENIPEFNVEWEGTQVEFTGKVVLMEEEFIAASEDKHSEVNSEEAECDFEKASAPVEKVYYMVASSYKNL